jgi:hypothetical protein
MDPGNRGSIAPEADRAANARRLSVADHLVERIRETMTDSGFWIVGPVPSGREQGEIKPSVSPCRHLDNRHETGVARVVKAGDIQQPLHDRPLESNRDTAKAQGATGSGRSTRISIQRQGGSGRVAAG